MSEEAIKIIRQAFDDFGSHGIEGLLAHTSPDVVVYPFPEWMEAPMYVGHQGYRELIDGWTEGFDEFVPEIHELREAGDQVVWLGWNTGRIRGTNLPIRQPVGGIFLFRDGQVAESRFFMTWEEALEAAGLA